MAYVTDLEPCGDECGVTGHIREDVLPLLTADVRFATGDLYQLHRDVGDHLTEFRSYRGALGSGSLQMVIDTRTGRFYADIDRFNPYADLVNILGHTFGEVLPHFFNHLFRRKQTK